jgi:SanA protein
MKKLLHKISKKAKSVAKPLKKKTKSADEVVQNETKEEKKAFNIKDLSTWNWKKIVIEVVVYTLLIFISYTAFVNFFYAKKLENKIYNAYDINNIESHEYGIIFGAGLNQDQTASNVLADRVQVGLNLLLSGKVNKLLLSGDNRYVNYDEPTAMKRYIEDKIGVDLVQYYVNAGQIVLDYGGRSTYDTCYRAKNIFNVENAVVITQEFHIVRTLTTCRLLGIDSIGVKSDLRDYSETFIWKIRDLFALDKAVLDLKVFKPKSQVL